MSLAIIELIRRTMRNREYEFAIPHFFEEMADDDIDMLDVESVVLNGRIRRRFTRDLRGARYEVVGPATDGRQVAVICRIKETGETPSHYDLRSRMSAVKDERMYNYGRCHVCGGKMRAKRIKQDFRVRKKLIVIEDVPAGVCGQCGEKIVSADVGRSLAGALKDTTRRRKARTIAVPVIRFAKDVA